MSDGLDREKKEQDAVRCVTSELLRERYWEFHHRSGLRVQVFPKKRHSCTAMFTVQFGAKDLAYRTAEGNEVRVPQGTAHFLEHKLFTLPDGSDVSERFASLGADANAWTDWDQTSYLFTTTEPPAQALRTLLTFVTHPYFTEQTIEKEQGIIAQEIRAEEDNPWERLYRQTMRALYARHPIRYPICGTPSSIRTLTPEILYACHAAFYRPENMTLTVCGDITWEEVARIADEALTDWGKNSAGMAGVIRRRYPETRPPKEKRVVGRAPVAKPLFSLTVKDAGVPQDAVGRLRREVVMGVISEALFSRAGSFYNDLFESGHVTPNYSYGYSVTPEIGYHAVSGETDDPDTVNRAYLSFLEKVRTEGMSPDDFERCRRVLYAGFVSGFDDPEEIADLMVEAQGGGYPLFERLRILQDITLEEGNRLLREVMDPEWTVLSILQSDPPVSGND